MLRPTWAVKKASAEVLSCICCWVCYTRARLSSCVQRVHWMPFLFSSVVCLIIQSMKQKCWEKASLSYPGLHLDYQGLSLCRLSKAFWKSTKLTYGGAFHSRICSAMSSGTSSLSQKALNNGRSMSVVPMFTFRPSRHLSIFCSGWFLTMYRLVRFSSRDALRVVWCWPVE